MKTGRLLTFWWDLITGFTSGFSPFRQLFPSGNVEVRRPWAHGWDIPDRKVECCATVRFLLFLRVLAPPYRIICTFGQEESGNNGDILEKRRRNPPINQEVRRDSPKEWRKPAERRKHQ